jgi:hypothetical protein
MYGPFGSSCFFRSLVERGIAGPLSLSLDISFPICYNFWTNFHAGISLVARYLKRCVGLNGGSFDRKLRTFGPIIPSPTNR